jgi:hypothetical protein
MILRDDISFNMDSLKRALVALRESTENSFYVHDLRDKKNGNGVLALRSVLSTNSRVAHFTVQRSIDINDGDIITLRTEDNRTLNYFVFDVERNRFTPDKFTMHALLWTLPVSGFGLCGKTAFDDLHGRRNVWIETAAAGQKQAS